MNAAESTVNHSAVSSFVLGCRPLLPLLEFPPLPPPLLRFGLWRAAVNNHEGLIATSLLLYRKDIFFPPFLFTCGRFRSLTRGLAVSELGIS